MDNRIADLQQFEKNEKWLKFIEDLEKSLEKERLSLYEELKPTTKFVSYMTMLKRVDKWIFDNVEAKFKDAIAGLP